MFCLTSFCCVCLNENEPFEYLSNKDDDQVLLINKLKYCAFETNLMGHIPKYICFKCLHILKLAYEFKKECRKSNTFINKYVAQLTNNTKSKDIQQTKLDVELVDIKECVLFSNMAHTYANVDYGRNTARIEEIFLKIEPTADVKFEILDNNQLEEEFPQLIVNQIKEEPLDDSINEVEYEIVDLKPQVHVEETGFSIAEVEESKNYFQKLQKNLNIFLKKSVYNNINKRVPSRIEDPIFKCPICQTSFPDCFLFHAHLTSQSCQHSYKKNPLVNKKFSCNICQKKFLWKASLKHHMLIHTGVKEHVCHICKKQFTQKSGLRRHMSIHKQDGAHRCKICSKSFYALCNLKTHMLHHTKIRPFSCTICDKNFFQKGHLTVHMLTHNATKQFECKICSKSFNYKSNFKQHLDLHLSKRDAFKCEHCPKAFPLKASLQKHLKIHLGIRDYMCDVCSKRFTSKSHLDRHMLIHTGNKIHKCFLCPKTFVYDSVLMTHIKTHFRRTVPETCDICGKNFGDPLALKRHKIIHTERRRKYKCPICEKRFFNKYNVENHLVTHSGARNFKCGMCPKTYAYATDLRRHLDTHARKKTV